MVETRLNLDPEVKQIFSSVDKGKNFVLSGGAGSGKTYSLVQVIRQALLEYPGATIACITFTNSAVREIRQRFTSKNVAVSTIHDFLWDNIKSFQAELKRAVLQLIAEEKLPYTRGDDGNLPDLEGKKIDYKEYLLVREGIISHDEVIDVAALMFATYPKLCDILKDRYRFILVDEYQDTSPQVVEILLNHLAASRRKHTVGFFGDSMQAIYEKTVGDLKKYVEAGTVDEIKKEQNRRCPRLVYELANKIRNDGLVQHASEDSNAPNMVNGVVKDGTVTFYYSEGVANIDAVKNDLGWDFGNPETVKELNLTHNLIAAKAGFGDLMVIYDGDKILDYKKRITDYIKAEAADVDLTGLNFGDVLTKLLTGASAAQRRRIEPTPGMQAFIDENPALFETAKSYPFETFKKIYLDKDSLIDDKKDNVDDMGKVGSKRDNLIKHLFKIQTCVDLYKRGLHNDFLRKTELKVARAADKRVIKELVDQLIKMGEKSIEEVIEFADKAGLCRKDDKLYGFIEARQYVYDRVKLVKFSEFQKLYEYLEGRSLFSTQHKVKGGEIENVLVILDNGGWNLYNFNNLFSDDGRETVRERSRKIFYVCCTRAKDNLAVYFHAPTPQSLIRAKQWFGETNVKKV
jgi:DNA helicase-2/ATP-dependent DNA helicase PcrA